MENRVPMSTVCHWIEVTPPIIHIHRTGHQDNINSSSDLKKKKQLLKKMPAAWITSFHHDKSSSPGPLPPFAAQTRPPSPIHPVPRTVSAALRHRVAARRDTYSGPYTPAAAIPATPAETDRKCDSATSGELQPADRKLLPPYPSPNDASCSPSR